MASKPPITQAQLETAHLVALHGNTEMLREGVELARRAILGGFVGVTEMAPQWLIKWPTLARGSDETRNEIIMVLIPILAADALTSVAEGRKWAREGLSKETIEAAQAELATRPKNIAGKHLF